ncbi:hypothetical protein E3C22_22580 [Jiella endophytica]|uniref:Uncharacterized protein n=1 Tax=Jiella endophytica TaxID=2558362 RepID=A0A4Y8RA64_9HYPH|nr:hypothetical protein [Jiella endophytica]TFF17926.1 hypothetical protein E3C22_22580 [Jiella endophytica]
MLSLTADPFGIACAGAALCGDGLEAWGCPRRYQPLRAGGTDARLLELVLQKISSIVAGQPCPTLPPSEPAAKRHMARTAPLRTKRRSEGTEPSGRMPALAIEAKNEDNDHPGGMIIDE